jgi:hypothetical protein
MAERNTASPAPPYPYDNEDNLTYASIIPPEPPINDTTATDARREPFHQQVPAAVAVEKQGKLGGTPDTGLDYKLVAFAPGDPEDPKNWSKLYKWYITMVVAVTCFVVALCSSIITSDVGGVSESFGVSHEAALVPISVFVVGFGVGPMIFAPLSEVFGRRII